LARRTIHRVVPRRTAPCVAETAASTRWRPLGPPFDSSGGLRKWAEMLAGHLRSGAGMWEPEGARAANHPPVTGPPAEGVVDNPPIQLPTSNFLADYAGDELNAFKANLDQGRVRITSAFRQGFSGLAAERYPTGETYVGEFVNARRHGTGTYSDAEAVMVSWFKAGRPTGEGVKIQSPWDEGEFSQVSTFKGKDDKPITDGQAAQITKNIGSTAVHPSYHFMGVTPPKTRVKPTYETEATAHFKANAVSPPQPKQDFLERLASVEANEAATNTRAARMSLIPRIN